MNFQLSISQNLVKNTHGPQTTLNTRHDHLRPFINTLWGFDENDLCRSRFSQNDPGSPK